MRIYRIRRQLLADHPRKRRKAVPTSINAVSKYGCNDWHALASCDISLSSIACADKVVINLLKPTGYVIHQQLILCCITKIYVSRTGQLTSRRCILNIYSTNILTEYFKHAAHSPFFLFKMPFIS